MIDPLLYPADSVRAAAARTDSLDELRLLEERERAHPTRPGGRRAVLEACAARRAEIERLERWRAEHPPWRERPYGPEGDHTHYSCIFCSVTALSPDDMREHQRQHHRRELANYGPPAEPEEPATVTAEEGESDG